MSSERSDETSQKYRDIRDLSHAFEMTQRRPLLIKRYTLHIKRFCHVERAKRRDISRKHRKIRDISHTFDMTERRPLLIKHYTLHITQYLLCLIQANITYFHNFLQKSISF